MIIVLFNNNKCANAPNIHDYTQLFAQHNMIMGGKRNSSESRDSKCEVGVGATTLNDIHI